MKVPCSPNVETHGLVYFKRMLEKIRLHSAGELREDLQGNLGMAMDDWVCQLLGVTYPDVCDRVREHKDDEAVLEWCFENGRKPSDQEIFVWNEYMRKVGWNDHLSDKLAQRIDESGLGDRDIQTMFDYIDADEGR